MDPSPGKSSLIFPVVLTVLGSAVIFGGVGYYIGSGTQPVPTSSTLATPSGSTTSTIATASAIPSPGVSSPPAAEETITPVDATRNLYTNTKLGFSVKIPKTVYGSTGCQATQLNGKAGYKLISGQVPIKPITDTDTVYFPLESYVETGGPVNSGNETYYTDCEKVETTLALLKNDTDIQYSYYKILIKNIADDQALNQFIKQTYGNACISGQKTASAQAGTYDVTFTNKNNNQVDLDCPFNFIYALKYSPTAHKVAQWNVGQDYRYYVDDSLHKTYDTDINKSFKFE